MCCGAVALLGERLERDASLKHVERIIQWAGSSDGKPLSIGMRGPDVARLRANLLKIRGVTRVEKVSPFFDRERARAVAELQRSHRLGVEGIAGVQTLVAVDAALAGSDTPLLSANNSRGG